MREDRRTVDRVGRRTPAGRPAPAGSGWASLRTATRAHGSPPGPSPTIVSLRPRPFIFQSLRRNICPHFYLTGPRGAIPVHAPHLLKGLVRQPQNTNRCQLRAGVHLEENYVLDVCLSARFNQCVFYEDELSRVDERGR
jgi:hypothetical protein